MKIAIVYSHKTVKTSQAAKLIKKHLEIDTVTDLDIESIAITDLKQYDLLILGVPTWFDGELPYYWDEVVSAIEDLDFKKVNVALFGNGDQKKHPENFGDAVGLLADVFKNSGASILGGFSTEGYEFESSHALRDGKFIGLILDFENQHSLNEERVKTWIKGIKNNLKL